MDPKELSAKGEESFQKGDYARAEELFLKVLGAGQRFADVYNKLGLISCAKGAYDKASKYFEALSYAPLAQEMSPSLLYTSANLCPAPKTFRKSSSALAYSPFWKDSSPFALSSFGSMINLHTT